jgi:cyclopropane fatty-acyl-phospholipid synthase-like methyltransferase
VTPRDDDNPQRVVAAAYDRMAERYLAWAGSIEDDARTTMLARFGEMLAPGARVLDLGCGAGLPSTLELSRRFTVTGVDISHAQIRLARANVPAAELICGDFSTLFFDTGSFDGVVALYAIIHLPREQHARLLGRIAGWLRPGGLLLAVLGAADSPGWVGEWLGEQVFFGGYDAEENRRLVRAAGFELLDARVRTTREPDGDADFLWVLARASRDPLGRGT